MGAPDHRALLVPRRRALGWGLLVPLGLVTGCSRSDGATVDPSVVPADWTTEDLNPLTLRVPAGMAPGVQDLQTDMPWDRLWTDDAEDPAAGARFTARLWGAGALQDASGAGALVAMTASATGLELAASVSSGDGVSSQQFTYDGGRGCLWQLDNGVSRALVGLTGPEVDDVLIGQVAAGLLLADEADPGPSLPEGWQRRQAEGVSVAVGRTWVDCGSSPQGGQGGPWQRFWAPWNGAVTGMAAVAVTSNLQGDSLTAAIDLVLADPGVTRLRQAERTPFNPRGGGEGTRVDFTWGQDVAYAGSMWFLRSPAGTIDAVLYLGWGERDTIVQETIEGSIAGIAA